MSSYFPKSSWGFTLVELTDGALLFSFAQGGAHFLFFFPVAKRDPYFLFSAFFFLGWWISTFVVAGGCQRVILGNHHRFVGLSLPARRRRLLTVLFPPSSLFC